MGYYGNIPATGDDNNFKILDDISSFTEIAEFSNFIKSKFLFIIELDE